MKYRVCHCLRRFSLRTSTPTDVRCLENFSIKDLWLKERRIGPAMGITGPGQRDEREFEGSSETKSDSKPEEYSVLVQLLDP